jgi:hypothetical protein
MSALVHTRLLGDLDGQAVQLFAFGLRSGQLLGSGLFQLSALHFEFGDGGLRSTASALGRDQEVTCVTVLHANDIAQVAQVDDFFQQNDLHRIFLLAVLGYQFLCRSVYGISARKRARLMAVSS